MLKKTYNLNFLFIVLCVFCFSTIKQFAIAGAGSGKYTRTKQPYWSVGQYNDALSDACQRHSFNQKKIQNLNIGYSGASGRGVTGIATREWNLHDPRGLAEVNITYHFFNDGYSNCKVYVARLRAGK